MTIKTDKDDQRYKKYINQNQYQGVGKKRFIIQNRTLEEAVNEKSNLFVTTSAYNNKNAYAAWRDVYDTLRHGLSIKGNTVPNTIKHGTISYTNSQCIVLDNKQDGPVAVKKLIDKKIQSERMFYYDKKMTKLGPDIDSALPTVLAGLGRFLPAKVKKRNINNVVLPDVVFSINGEVVGQTVPESHQCISEQAQAQIAANTI